jgi:formylglycine-generating enzyme required for sulfatase activity
MYVMLAGYMICGCSGEVNSEPHAQPLAGEGETVGSPGRSCEGRPDTECGGVSCCASLVVPGGTFLMGRSTTGSDTSENGHDDELPEHEVRVETFALDAFEVTVGRFRAFVEAYDGTPPEEGAGDHHGLSVGWQSAWNEHLPTRAELEGALSDDHIYHYNTWTEVPGQNENAAINFVTWYEAFAFCVWDHGRLPTEAEWEYAAAGGEENRLYPWGSESDWDHPEFANTDSSNYSPSLPVGSHPLGDGRWGHSDLGGGMWEITYDAYDADWYSGGGTNASYGVNRAESPLRVVRGGGWSQHGFDHDLRVARRTTFDRDVLARSDSVGFRCVHRVQ